MRIPFTNGPPMHGQRMFRGGTFTSTWLAATDTLPRSSRKVSPPLIRASKRRLGGRSRTPDVKAFSPELTDSADNPAPVEKAIAVAAQVQLGYDSQGAGNGPDDGKRPMPGLGSRQGKSKMRIAAGLIFASTVSLCLSGTAWSQTPATKGIATPP